MSITAAILAFLAPFGLAPKPADKLKSYPDCSAELFAKEPWRKTLWDAADLIREHGWSCGRWQDTNGAFCLEGAINMVSLGHPRIWVLEDYESPDFHALREPAFLAVVKQLGHNHLWVWNDNHGSKRKAIKLLKKAAMAS